jgi:Transglycosylase SLT domain
MASLLDIPGLLLKTTPSFRDELYRLATLAGYNPSFIAAVIALESGFDPAALNPHGHALGLLQWWDSYWPSTARAAGMPDVKWAELAHMSAVEQLPFVIAYFQQATQKPLVTPTDYRLAVFMPAFVGAPPSTVLGQKGSHSELGSTGLSLGTIYDQNAGLDLNHDGVISVGDVGQGIEAVIADARRRAPVPVTDLPPVNAPSTFPATAAEAISGAAIVSLGLFFCPYCSKPCNAHITVSEVE